ncbi:hypothetical protein [Actinokineospora sp. UTMC 2448]|uniref:hypothetical protein n=1 Tax=Actinokineospora sp. UTMC 2448 TaxID=2268449 RepID=UPI002164201A|nr:hypothetical protein [Actinokineospora sp. UTMC 2448]UVS79479.1 hypothetical protein Actkin_03227 [Actinokineospora sp. UTMC 2448]
MKTLVCLALVAAVSAGCAGSGHEHHQHHSTTADDTAQLRGTATTYLGLLSGGDPTTAWGMWTPEAQQRQPREVFADRIADCAPGVPYEVLGVVSDGPDLARVSWRHGEHTGELRLRLHEGHWRVDTPDTITCGAP